MSDADVVAEAGALLWKRSQLRPQDVLVAGSARVLRAVWMILSTQDRLAKRTMVKFERASLKYQDDRHLGVDGHVPDPRLQRSDLWPDAAIPPRAGLDRHRNLSMLLKVMEQLREQVSSSRDDVLGMARLFCGAAMTAFPQYAVPKSQRAELSHQITLAWLKRARRAHASGREVSSDLMVVDGLEVLGVRRATAQNWFKGVRV